MKLQMHQSGDAGLEEAKFKTFRLALGHPGQALSLDTEWVKGKDR